MVKALPAPGGVAPPFHAWERGSTTSTDADGQFTLGELAPGPYAVQARAADGGEGIAPPVTAGSREITIRIERAGMVEGTLVGFTQAPGVTAVPVGTFKLHPGVVEGARFRIPGLRPGKYLVNAQTSNGGDAQAVDVRAGVTTRVVLTSHGQGAIDGTVLDFRTRAPIPNATCHVAMSVGGDMAFSGWDPAASPRSDAAGHVRLAPAPAGAVTVSCMMPVRRSMPAADATLVAGGTASVQLLSVELTQENPGSIGIEFDWRTTPPRIARVKPGSSAAKVGLLVGDLVTEVNGTSVQGLNGSGVQRLIECSAVGDDVRVAVMRGGVAKAFTAKMQNE
jgi:hypothetical protein